MKMWPPERSNWEFFCRYALIATGRPAPRRVRLRRLGRFVDQAPVWRSTLVEARSKEP
jgi:hypothetical protein